MNENSSVKKAAILLICITFVCGIVRLFKLRERITLPAAALSLVVLMDALTLFYAPSGKFALYEFLHVMLSFCMALLLLIFAKGSGVQAERWVASVLEGSLALTGLVSIDLISTRLISTPVLQFISLFNGYYSNLNGLESGACMTSMFVNPNIFAGMVGIGVLLFLGLALSAEKRREHYFHLI